MPWYALRADLPDNHKMWSDPGSQHEAVLRQIGYVEVPAPGSETPSEDDERTGDEQRPPDEKPAEVKPGRKAG